MRQTIRNGWAILMVAFWLLGGCAKSPVPEIDAAKKAVEAARAAGSSEYLSAEDKAVGDKLNAALEEVKTQEGKMALFRNYDQAEKMLAGVRQEAGKLETATAAKKEEAKKEALSLKDAAAEAIQKAKDLLTQAPKGKGTEADIAALNADMTALEEALPAVQQVIDKGDYPGAIAKAKPIKDKAEAVSGQVQQAIEKIKAVEAERMKTKKGTKNAGKKR